MGLDFMDMLRDLFEDADHQVLYTPVSGTPQTIFILPKQPDMVFGIEGGRIQTNTTLFEILVDDVAQPVKGDTLTYNNATYIVQNARREDNERLIWTVDTYPQ
jgi:hypothetical protein